MTWFVRTYDFLFSPKDGLERERWFLRRSIRRTKTRLSDLWADHFEEYPAYSEAKAKLARQIDRLVVINKRLAARRAQR